MIEEENTLTSILFIWKDQKFGKGCFIDIYLSNKTLQGHVVMEKFVCLCEVYMMTYISVTLCKLSTFHTSAILERGGN